MKSRAKSRLWIAIEVFAETFGFMVAGSWLWECLLGKLPVASLEALGIGRAKPPATLSCFRWSLRDMDVGSTDVPLRNSEGTLLGILMRASVEYRLLHV